MRINNTTTVLIFSVVLMLLSIFSAQSQGKTLRDTLLSDLDSFVSILEQTHPDPYTRFGGKVLFHKEAAELRNKLKTGDYDIREFAELLSRFLVRLGDGHSFVGVPPLPDSQKGPDESLCLPIEISTIPDGIILTKVPVDYKHLIGSRIIAVEGVPVGELTERTKQFAAVENLYGAYVQLEGGLTNVPYLKQLLSWDKTKKSVVFRLITPEGKEQELSLEVIPREMLANTEMTARPAWDLLEETPDYMYYRFMDEARTIMLFRLGSMTSRENLIYMRDIGRPSYLGEIESFYRYVLRREMPADEAEALAGIPSIAETFRAMLLEMKAAGAENLIIDLRGNGGGWNTIVFPTLYMLYGDRYLAKEMNANLYHLISPLYLANRNVTLDEYNRLPKVDMDPFHRDNVTDYKMGDYTFAKPASQSVDQIRNYFVQAAMGNVSGSIGDLGGKPLYKPNDVYVVTDARTYSAAFHYTFYMWNMGAKIVGTPSSLATNTYMEGTPYKLPLTGIGGGLSNSLQVFLPQDDPRATVFYPDMMPGVSDYKRYGFDKHSEILYLIDKIRE